MLSRNARASYRDIGEQVGLSANAVTQRIRRLEQARVIRGYTTLIAPEIEGEVLQAVVHLHTATDVDLVPLEEALWAVPGVVEVLDLAGSIDYEIRLRARTQSELYEGINRLRSAPGVTDMETRVVLRVVPRIMGGR